MVKVRREWAHNDHSFGGLRRDCPYCFRATIADLERQLTEAQGRLKAVEKWSRAKHCCQHDAKGWLDRILFEENE